MLSKLPAKADALMATARNRWLEILRGLSSRRIVTVQEDRRVVDQVQDLTQWKVDFVVIKDKDKTIRGVVSREQLEDFIKERKNRAVVENSGFDLRRISFHDLILNRNVSEYYVLKSGGFLKNPGFWLEGLPPREVIVLVGQTVQAVIDRRWFRRWQGFVRRAWLASRLI